MLFKTPIDELSEGSVVYKYRAESVATIIVNHKNNYINFRIVVTLESSLTLFR